MLRLLGPKSAFSHYRSVALALETLGDPRGAEPLAELLQRDGMTGHIHLPLPIADKQDAFSQDMAERITAAWSPSNRSDAVRELALARALYRCGDDNGLAEKILNDYTRDLRGHFARHAKAVLESSQR
jgi:hypothetical protein